MSSKFNKLSIFLSSTFVTSSILGISIGIPLYLNLKNNNNVENFSNSNKIKNNESNQIVFNNNILDKLNNNINEYIVSNKLSYLDFESYLLDETKLGEFKNNLVQWTNNKLSLESIGDVNLVNEKNSIKLIISSSLNYSFSCENNSQYFDIKTSNLIFNNLDFYKELNFNSKNISDFKSKLQEQINSNKYTNNEFKLWVESSEFKDFIVQNLKSSVILNLDSIGSVSFDVSKNELLISSSGMYKFTLDYQKIENIIIFNFDLYTDVKLVNLNLLFNTLKNEIKIKQFTNSEFSKYVQSNTLNIKQLISENLYIDENNKISISEIGNISVENGNLIINLNSNSSIKYSIDENNNFSIENDVLTVKNLVYFNVVKLINLSRLFDVVQNIIYNQNFLEDEFKRYVQTNNVDFKDTIISNLFVSETDTIDSDSISNIGYNNSKLNIELLSSNYSKYEIEESNNFSLENNILSISNLNYYSTIRLTKLDSLYNAIQNKIDIEKFSSSDLNEYIYSNYEDIKNIVANNLYISDTQTISSDNISAISVNESNLTITLSSLNYVKYSNLLFNNISLVDNTLTLYNLNFFSKLKLSNLHLVYNSIQSIIDEYEFTNTQFYEYLITNEIVIKKLILDLFQINSINIFDSNIISSIEYINGDLNLNLSNIPNIIYTIEYNENFSLNNNILSILNLSYFSIVNLTNLDKLHSEIQSKINANNLSSYSFIDYVNINQEEIKKIVSNNLSLSLKNIDSVIVDNNSDLVVSLLPDYNIKFSIIPTSNFVLDNNLLTIKNFAFNSVINLIKLDDLFNSIQNLIFSNGFSQSEFSIYVTQNQESIKELVANNLYLSQSNKFKVDDIISVLMRNSRLVITLNPDIKYSAEKNSNVILDNNLLTIYNFEYQQIINLTKLDVLWNAINDYIGYQTRWYTIDEFKNAITVSPNDIKKLVKSNLYININTTIALDKITNVSINENNQLEITLDNKSRYTMSSYNNAELASNKLIIKNLNYFNLISISNTNKRNLETSIQNYITNNKVTIDNMDSHMSNINNLIFSTKTTDNQNLGNFVSSVTYSGQSFIVKLINYYKTDGNIDYINLGWFTLADLRIVIGVNDIDLNNLWTSIQEYIWNNKVEVDNINSNNMSNIKNLIFSTKTTDNQNLGNFVSSVTQLNNSFTISLDKNHKMNFKTLSKNIQINSNSIVMSNFTFYIPPQENWFTWDGNKITGLTNLGKQQSYIVLPAKTTDIANDVFANNYLVTYVDMSLTQIRRIPDGVAFRTSLFYKSSLKQIILPPLLEYIGAWTFANSGLRLISTPKKTISIGDYAFYDTYAVNINQDFINKVSVIGNGVFEQAEFSNLSLDLSNVSSIGHSVFSGSSIVSVVLPNTMTSIPNNLFYNTKYLQSVSIPNSVTSIGSFAFAKTNLKKIIIPEGVTAIRSYAFENAGPNLYLYLPNSITIIEKNALAGLGNTGERIYVKKDHPSNLEYLIRNAGYERTYALWFY